MHALLGDCGRVAGDRAAEVVEGKVGQNLVDWKSNQLSIDRP